MEPWSVHKGKENGVPLIGVSPAFAAVTSIMDHALQMEPKPSFPEEGCFGQVF